MFAPCEAKEMAGQDILLDASARLQALVQRTAHLRIPGV
jgi:hypothetical protein